VERPLITYAVLALSAVFEGISWTVAFREFRRERPRDLARQGLLRAVERSKDPTTFTVLFEDSAALIGLAVAFCGVFASAVLGWTAADGIASLVIGAILAATAAALARETKSLMTGEAASPGVVTGIRELVTAEPAVAGIHDLRSIHLGPERILVAIALDFADSAGLDEIEATLARLDAKIRERFPPVQHLFLELRPESAAARTGADAATGGDQRGPFTSG
jgi:divalent metal cation (Fe/Co/Zn/Cd) transporter